MDDPIAAAIHDMDAAVRIKDAQIEAERLCTLAAQPWLPATVRNWLYALADKIHPNPEGTNQ